MWGSSCFVFSIFLSLHLLFCLDFSLFPFFFATRIYSCVIKKKKKVVLVCLSLLSGISQIQSWGKGEGGVVSQVIVATGQPTKCKDLFSLEAKAKIRPRLDFSGSEQLRR